MIINAQIEGEVYRFDTEPRDESQKLGEGGEAVVLRFTPQRGFTAKHGNGRFAAKLFSTETKEQRDAIAMRQTKFRSLPTGLPRNVVMPVSFIFDLRTRLIIGYVMPLVEDAVPLSRYMIRKWRVKNGVTHLDVVQLLIKLHALVAAVHRAGVVIGDFNHDNVLVAGGEVYLIDFDSAQWGQWPCIAATAEFTDPTLLDKDQCLRKDVSYTQTHDWYAFAVMVFQLLTYHHPYVDGTHFPKPGVDLQVFPGRVSTRLSTFDAHVFLDEKLIHPASLPDELGQLMQAVFTKDYRIAPFPLRLLQDFKWMTCKCGRQHGRTQCPNRKCGAPGIASPTPRHSTAAPLPRPAQARPASSGPSPAGPATTVFQTPGTILAASFQGRMRYVYHENGAYYREGGKVIWKAQHDPRITALVAGDRTVMAAGSSFTVIDDRGVRNRTTQQHYGATTVATNSHHVYWLAKTPKTGLSLLVRDNGNGGLAPITTVATNLTSVWAGERFGLAMVQAGVLTRILAFDAAGSKVVKGNIPTQPGKIVDAQCVIGDLYAWLTIQVRERGTNRIINRCYVIDSQARLRATAVAPAGDKTWLERPVSAGLSTDNKLYVTADTGIVQVGMTGNTLQADGTIRNTQALARGAATTVGLCLTDRGIVHASPSTIRYVS